MINFLFCLLYLIISIIIIYLCGRIYPREWIKERKFPFKNFFIESKGKIYERIGIKSWKTKLPDASLVMNKIFKKWIPKKRIESVNNIKTLIKETCVVI